MSLSVKHLTHAHGLKVFTGLSGGVDSAVTALLLKEAGAKVTGVFIQGWYPPGIPCSWADDRRDAMRVAARLGIPFHTLDASKEYKQAVIDYLITEYAAGRTPNPDVFCNRDVKFGAFYRYAKQAGADYIATGHYAIATDGHLFRGADTSKDQSYFLWAIDGEALTHTLFPLGGFTKEEVRSYAKEQDLPVAHKKDSQGICFLGNISLEDFLRSYADVVPGSAYDEAGAVVGTHDGAVLYTPGERAPLKNALPGPWYVISKDVENNTLTVTNTPSTTTRTGIVLENTHFFQTPVDAMSCEAQYRYHGLRISGTYHPRTRTFIPDTPVSEVVPAGQSLVMYDPRTAECLGGGIIRSVTS